MLITLFLIKLFWNKIRLKSSVILKNIYLIRYPVIIKKINIENGILKVSHKETKEDPYTNIRKYFVEGGEYLAKTTGFSDNGVFASLKQGIDTMATLPVWLEMPPLPGDMIIVKVKKIIPEKRKIYSSLLKIVRRENTND